MQRITVTLHSAQAEELARVSAQNGIAVSALVRYAVGRLLDDRVVFLAAARTLGTRGASNEEAEE